MSNPYESLEVSNRQSDSNTPPVYPLVSRAAVVFVLGMTIGGALIGGVLGMLIGEFAPGYYRAVFPFPVVANPIEVGLGLGASQGAGFGAILAVALIAVTYFLKYKRQFPAENTP